MARRTVLTGRQRSALFALPQREADLLRHYTLSDEDLQNIGARRRPRNKLGFALQLCVLPLPGPPAGSRRVRSAGRRGFHRTPARLGWGRTRRLRGAVRDPTRASWRTAPPVRIPVPSRAARRMSSGTGSAKKQSNEDLVRRFVEACRHTRTILPATTTIERILRRRAGRRGTPDSKPASPSGFRPGFGATSRLAVRRYRWKGGGE